MNSSPEIDTHETPDSSNIKAIAYHYARSVLIIFFRSGSIWEYQNVPKSLYFELKSAPSTGKFFHVMIRNIFAAQQITDSRHNSLIVNPQLE